MRVFCYYFISSLMVLLITSSKTTTSRENTWAYELYGSNQWCSKLCKPDF